MLRINDVFLSENEHFRILSILPSAVVWISLDKDSAFPAQVDKNELIWAIEQGKIERAPDPFQDIVFQSPESGSTNQLKRDENHVLIKPLIEHHQYYIPRIRSAMIQQIIEEQGSTKQTLYRLARRYWQRGQTPNALIPDYKNSGAKGVRKMPKDAKLGRPRKYAPGVGKNVDIQIERLFRTIIETHILTDEKHSFPYAHRKFKARYATLYPDMPVEESPSIWQLKHFYDREYGAVEQVQKRYRDIEYKKDIRPLLSTSNTQVLGPGSRFEIDATIADIYLVSDSSRKNIIGRPTVYFVIDVFSRMVAGLYIGSENPSYVAAMQALTMAMSDKVAYCERYGFKITSEQWPVAGLPDAILADRGELLGHQIEALERSFSVRIENAPPYRGDAKGIVERHFRTSQAHFKPFAPGVVEGVKEKKRGGSDYRLDAKLTVYDFTQIIVGSVLYHNQYHTLTKYDRDIDMPNDLPIIPLALWNWGVQHRTGRLRVVSEDALYVAILPRTKATVSDLGINVFGVYYSSSEIVNRGWLHRKKTVSRPSSLQVAYDPRSTTRIYIFFDENSIEYWIGELSPRSREFEGCSFWDVWQAKPEQKTTMASHKVTADAELHKLEEQIDRLIKSAEKKGAATVHLSNKERISAIRPNRHKAKQTERQNGAKSQSTDQNIPEQQLGEVIPMPKQVKKPPRAVQNNAADDEQVRYPSFINELFDEDE